MVYERIYKPYTSASRVICITHGNPNATCLQGIKHIFEIQLIVSLKYTSEKWRCGRLMLVADKPHTSASRVRCITHGNPNATGLQEIKQIFEIQLIVSSKYTSEKWRCGRLMFVEDGLREDLQAPYKCFQSKMYHSRQSECYVFARNKTHFRNSAYSILKI